MRNIQGYILLGLTAAVLGVYGALAWLLFAPTATAEEQILQMPTRIVEITQVAAQPGEAQQPAQSTPTRQPTQTLQPTFSPTAEPTTAPATVTTTTPTEAPARFEALTTESLPTEPTRQPTAAPSASTAPVRPRGEAELEAAPQEITIGCDPQELIDALNAQEDIINLNGGCTYSYTSADNSNSFGSNALPIINYDVTINGNGATIERDGAGGNFFRLFFVTFPGGLTLNDVTLQGGDVIPESGIKGNGGAILARVGMVTLNTVNLFGNRADYGGAIYIFDGADLVADSGSISGNLAFLGGGGIYTTGSDSLLTLTDTVLFDNDGLEGGAVYVGGGSDLIATNATFGQDGSPNEARQDVDGNTFWGRGGAIYSTGSGTILTLDASTVEANAAYIGGGIYNVGGGQVTVQNGSRIGGTTAAGGNTAIADGGGVVNQGVGSLFVLDDSTVAYNEATSIDDAPGVIDNDSSDGGGIFNRGGAAVQVTGASIISDNIAAIGGGIFSQDIGSTVHIDGATIADNSAISASANIPQDSAPEDGGGIYNKGGSVLTLSNATLQNNAAHDRGGGLFQQDQDSGATVTSAIFDQNTAYNGGGVFVSGGSTMSFTNTDFSSNTATSVTDSNENLGGGGLFADSLTTVTLSGGTFSQNSANSGAGILVVGATTMTVTGTDFTQNTATGTGSEAGGLSTGLGGGGLRAVGFDTTVTLSDIDFTQNSAQDGGALLVSGGAGLTVTGADFVGNSASGSSTIGDLRGGGAIWTQDTGTNLFVYSSTFTQNQAESGAALVIKNGAFVQVNGAQIGSSGGTDANSGDTLLHTQDNGSQLQVILSDIRNNDVGIIGYNDDAFLLLRQTMIEETGGSLQAIILANDGDSALDSVRTILVNVTISHEVNQANYATFRGFFNINPIELYSVTVVDNEEILANDTLLPGEGEIQVYNSILQSNSTVCSGSGYVSFDYNVVSDSSCNFAGTGDQEDTDAGLTAQTQGGAILHYEPDPLGAAAGAIPTDFCDIDEDMLDNPRPRGRACEPGAIEIVEAFAAYTSQPPANSNILLEPLAGEVDSADIDISETGTKDLTIEDYTLAGDPEISVSGDAAPFTITDGSGATRTLTVSCSSAQAATDYEAVLTVIHTGYQETATYRIRCEVGGAPQTPTIQTVGLYQGGIWWIGSSDEMPLLEDTYSFGPATGGWQPIVGDWNGDGIATAGLYKEGTWILREVSGEVVTYNQFRFGSVELGWQPIVGDWNGSGAESIGLYKDGLFLLRNSNSQGGADYSFRFGDGAAGWTALSGDWDGDFVDSIGLYKDGLFLLRNSNSQGGAGYSFRFGGSTGHPLAGDWDGDGTDTVGVYNNPNWLLRNSNSQGGADRVFQFGYIGVDFIPVIGTYSAMGGSGLDVVTLSFGLAVPDTPVEEITEEPTLTPTQEVTEEPQPEITPEITEEPTALPTEEVTEEPQPEISEEPTALPTEEVTEEPQPEVTQPVETTPDVTPSPTQTDTPTETPVETTPEVTPSPTPTQAPTEATPSPEPATPAPEVTPETTPEVQG